MIHEGLTKQDRRAACGMKHSPESGEGASYTSASMNEAASTSMDGIEPEVGGAAENAARRAQRHSRTTLVNLSQPGSRAIGGARAPHPPRIPNTPQMPSHPLSHLCKHIHTPRLVLAVRVQLLVARHELAFTRIEALGLVHRLLRNGG